MKIVVVNYRYFKTSGAETFMFKLIKLLEDHGDTVIPFSTVNEKNVATPYAKYFAKARSSDGNVLYANIQKTPKNIHRMLAGAFYNRDAEHCLRTLLRAEKPDVVLVLQQMNALSPSVFAACRKEGVPVVHRLSDFNLLCPRYDFLRELKPCTDCIKGCFIPAVKHKCVKGSLAATMVRSLSMRYHRMSGVYNSIARYIVPSSFTRDLMIKGGFKAEKIVTLPTFVDTEGMVPATGAGEYFLFMGRISEEKGIADMIRALKFTKGNVKLKLAGSTAGAYPEAMIALAGEEGLADRVEFLGFTGGEQLANVIRNSRAVLLPAVWYENMPNAVLEGYAYGRPVIVSRLGSLPGMVKEGETGLLCEPGDPKSLAEKMDQLWSNDSLTIEMGKKARAFCDREYGPETYYTKIMDLFKGVIAESGRK